MSPSLSAGRHSLRKLLAPATFVALSVATTALASFLAGRGSGAGFLDAFVGSNLSADYSDDEKLILIPPLDSGIIDEVRRDNREQSDESGGPVDGATPPASGGPASSPPGPGRTPTPGGPSSPTLPVPTPTLPVPTPTLPVPTPTLPPLPTLPPVPTLQPLPTLAPLP